MGVLFVCLFFGGLFLRRVVLPVDTPGPVHQIAELRSLVFGLENKELTKSIDTFVFFKHSLEINRNICMGFISFFIKSRLVVL